MNLNEHLSNVGVYVIDDREYPTIHIVSKYRRKKVWRVTNIIKHEHQITLYVVVFIFIETHKKKPKAKEAIVYCVLFEIEKLLRHNIVCRR